MFFYVHFTLLFKHSMIAGMENTPRIWVLTDDKPGNRTQSLGVAAKLPWGYEEKRIDLNKWAKLPNRLLGKSRISGGAELHAPWPDIVIAAGRRLVPLLRYIKKQYPQCFTVYLMRPDAPLADFNLLAIPQHDRPKDHPNLITTLGAPHGVTAEKLASAAAEWQERLAHLPAPRIAVLAGGDSASARFALEDFYELGNLASMMANAAGGSLMVTTSRRTGARATDYLRLALSAEHELFAWSPEAPNPYHAFLGLAEAIIVTGDSMSMCAEACGTGKPVFIYVPRKGSLAPKLRSLHQSLCDAGLARLLTANMPMDWQPTAMLDEAGRVAAEVVKRVSGWVVE